MIAGILHEGSGLGDQLFRYVTLRTIAEEKGYEWGMIGALRFKGKDFMDLEMGKSLLNQEGYENAKWMEKAIVWNEKDVRENGIDVRSYDPEINFIQDNTIIDGSFEDEKYWGNKLDDIRDWLSVEPLKMADDVCVIGFRGGEYSLFPDLFLSNDYWSAAIKHMRDLGIDKFEIHTDDKKTAEAFAKTIFSPYLSDRFGNWIEYKVIHDIALNWRSVRYAKHLIIPNSAFYIFPALLGEAEEVIAPRYWARRNLKTWARPACYYKDKRFLYI